MLDPGLIQLVSSAYKSTKASELRAKDGRKEVDMGEGERSYLDVDALENSNNPVQICLVQSLKQSWCKFIIPKC